MKKVKWLVLIVAIVLMMSGVAYAGWTEQIQLEFNTKTASTELSILEVQTDGLRVDTSVNNQLTIRAKNVEQGGEAAASIVFANTGTIPIDISNIAVSNVSGYSSNNKNNMYIDICAYSGGNVIFNDERNVSYWKSTGSVKLKSSLTEVPVGGTVVLKINVRFDNSSGKKSSKWADKDYGHRLGQKHQQVFENVTFILKPEYTRFNED